MRNKSVACTGCGKRFASLGSLANHARRDSSNCTWEMRFWGKVDKSGGPNACWPYCRLDALGYGRFLKQGPYAYAHRTAWQSAKGAIPRNRDVLHRCDNRSCCNPAHLYLGTHQDNMLDMYRKDRRSNCFTTAQVKAIRSLLGTMRQCDIARRYKTSDGVISKLATGQSYRFVK